MARLNYVELPSVTAHELTRGFYQGVRLGVDRFGPDYAATTSGDTDLGLKASRTRRWRRRCR